MKTTNTTRYEFSHGRKPKGRGYWGLEITFTDGHGRYSSETVFAYGTLAEARKTAWNQIKSTVGGAKSIVEVIVLP